MAYYNYKYVRDRLPTWLTDEMGPDYEGSADYDGDQWCAAYEYMNYLENIIKGFDPTFDFTKKGGKDL